MVLQIGLIDFIDINAPTVPYTVAYGKKSLYVAGIPFGHPGWNLNPPLEGSAYAAALGHSHR